MDLVLALGILSSFGQPPMGKDVPIVNSITYQLSASLETPYPLRLAQPWALSWAPLRALLFRLRTCGVSCWRGKDET